MGVVTTTERVKRTLRIPAGVTVHDTRIGEIVDEVEDSILSDLQLTAFEPANYTEWIDTWPGGQSVITTKRFPVRSVVALTSSGTALTEDTDFRVEESGRITLLASGACWPSERSAVQVMYSAGLVAVAGTTPANIIRWATLMSALQYNTEPMAGYEQQGIRPVTTKMSRGEEGQIRREIARIASRYITAQP